MQQKDISRNMAKIACNAISDKKGEDIRVIDISQISVLADYFIISNGSNESQVRAIVDNVEEQMYKAGYQIRQREGYGSGGWVLLDFGDIIVHVFDKENRLFYDLERIWRDGKQISVDDLQTFKYASAYLLRGARHALHDTIHLRTSAIRRRLYLGRRLDSHQD